jgi:hypothetical protein
MAVSFLEMAVIGGKIAAVRVREDGSRRCPGKWRSSPSGKMAVDGVREDAGRRLTGVRGNAGRRRPGYSGEPATVASAWC